MALKREKVVPHLREKSKKVALYRSHGNVYTIKEFIDSFTSKADLNKAEKELIKKEKNNFTKKLPNYLSTPLARSTWLKKSGSKTIVNRGGARSAFWPAKKLKLKGCKPIKDLNFPTEILEFGAEKMDTGEISFGTLSSENILREVLAYCLFKKAGLLILQTPFCVFEYVFKGTPVGYCLVSKKATDTRLEKDIDYFGLAIKDLIYLKFMEKKAGIKLLEGDAGFKGLDHKWYCKKKSNILLKMNFNGCFRGILNSNIGNDLVHNKELYICDFDTTTVIDIPKKPSYRFIKGFMLWALVELLKTSPTVWDYVDLENKSENQAIKELNNSLYKNSLLWKYYYVGLMKEAKKRKWKQSDIKRAIKEIQKIEVYKELLLDVVPNSKLIKESYHPELSFYSPHA